MTIFKNDVLIAEVSKMDLETAQKSLTKIVEARLTATAKAKVARIIMGIEASKFNADVKIAKGRNIPMSTLKALVVSPVYDYIREFIMAALDPRGPYQSREIMLLASQMKSSKAEFITANGIPQVNKNQVGYILTMAGFERCSHYDKTRRMPVKAWKIMHGTKNMTIDDRVQEVLITINANIKEPTTPTYSLLGSYL